MPGGRQPSSFARLRVLSAVLPLVVLAIALAVSYAVWQRERREIERVLKEDFDRRVNGLQGVGYSVLVPPGQLELHLAAVRAEGFPTYALRHEGERPLYTSAIFFAPPSAAELSTIGSDYFAEPSRRAAMEQARDTAGVATRCGICSRPGVMSC